MAQQNLEVCPVELAQNDKVVGFTNVDGSAFIFAETSLEGKPVRAELDEIYADSPLSFETAQLKSVVGDMCDVNDMDEVDDYDMLFIYS